MPTAAENPTTFATPDENSAETQLASHQRKMVEIPAGDFLMGSPADEVGRDDFDDDESQHAESIDRSFFLSAYEVTNGEFREFADSSGYVTEAEKKNPNESNWRIIASALTDNHPVVFIGWGDAIAYCKWLSEKEGKKFRLPTEREWEYACRAGTATRFNCGDELTRQDANFSGSGKMIQPVGTYAANSFGLFDMHGNVAEWCQDEYRGDYGTQDSDYAGYHVLRGGAWSVEPDYCRSAHREGMTNGNMMTGFRIAHD